MDELSNKRQAVELFQRLGFKQYEAKCFVALSQLPEGTAKEISETSDVPRTRVYEAIRVLESKGLVEVQHSTPQRFRAVPVDEAVSVLRREHDSRLDTLTGALESLEPASSAEDEEVTHEVWSLSGATAIANRTTKVVGDADEEAVVVVGHELAFTDDLADALGDAQRAGVDVVVGAVTDELREQVTDRLPSVEAFTSGLGWLHGAAVDPGGTVISRLVLVDRETILVSSFSESATDSEPHKAVLGKGLENGFVVIARRMMSTGLDLDDDPGKS
jgi:sugar-specific transcriptional regulator TrmB